MRCLSCVLMLAVFLHASAVAQEEKTTEHRASEIARGSSTAKGGFENEDQIRDKFNNWKTDAEAQAWLKAMNYAVADVIAVKAAKPHGEKVDVEVRVTTKHGEKTEGISIKLVSNPDGFNQIDKRWLATYATKWTMSDDIHETLKHFVGELPPSKPGRDKRRTFFDEMDESKQKAIVDFFTSHREQIVSDLFAGDGDHAAGWLMVTLKVPKSDDKNASKPKAKPSAPKSTEEPSRKESLAEQPDWVLVSTQEAIHFFGDGPVEITRAGSLKIGRITMQRKGGDNGRPSANMLQFKINPVDLFELKASSP